MKRLWQWLGGALIGAAVLGGCGREPRLEKLEGEAVVLAFGDSLTFGTGAAGGESYPAVLERAIGRKVVNGGIPGETSAAGLQRLPAVLDDVKPRLLILCHAGNDFLRRLDEGKAADNVKAMVQLAHERGIPVVLLATPKPGLPPSIPVFYGEIATELGVPFEEGVIKTVLFDNALKSDMVHPNAQGYARIAVAVEKVLRKSGAL
jgi:lysophospholipase L1-like esterase